MPGNRPSALLALGCAVLLGACGSSSAKHAPTPAGGQASSSSSPVAGANREASKRPNQIVADAAAALSRAHGYVMQGTINQNDQQLHLEVTVASPHSMDLKFSIARASVEVRVLPRSSYIRANRTFWTAHAGARGAALAGHWIQAQPSDAQGLTSALGHFGPTTLARCLTENHGALTVAGRTTIRGHAAVIVRDAGNAPGSSPGTLAVATNGQPYPLQVIGTGPQRPGGRIDVCNDGKAGDSRGDVTFSQFGAVKPIAAPVKAVRPGSVTA